MKINIHHLAKLANLSIQNAEEEKLEKQLDAILKHINKLSEVNTENVTETNHITGLTTVLREDITTTSLSQEDALKTAQVTHNGFFKVKAILEGD